MISKKKNKNKKNLQHLQFKANVNSDSEGLEVRFENKSAYSRWEKAKQMLHYTCNHHQTVYGSTHTGQTASVIQGLKRKPALKIPKLNSHGSSAGQAFLIAGAV